MSTYTNELEENFTPKDQKKDSAQTILSRDVLKKFANRRSDIEGWKQFIFHVSFILFSQYLIYYTNPNTISNYFIYFIFSILNILSFIFCGWTISFLFTGLHECVHHTAFKTPIYNDIVGYLFGFACFRGVIHYRYYHWAHHRFTGNTSKDPELKNTFIDLDISGSLLKYLLYLSGIPFWIDRITTLSRHSLLYILDQTGIKLNQSIQNLLLPKELEYYLQRKQRRHNTTLEAFLFVIGYVLILILFPVSFLWRYWFLPSLIGQCFLRGYLIAEHRECKANTNMFSNTRTTKTFWLECKLAWNMPYHIEHHAFPYIPFYLLPDVHELLVKNLGGEDKYYAKSDCKPDGHEGYLSVHRQILKDILTIN